ncbi:putative metalloprotease arx1 [Perkinsus olseni]|uniref:Putative metalloprotease arx1 n=2 Tax=Perkinsus olseni TaxID=32597 RepID=A0A7J6S9K4_PEROL|nr:putative metalloprotease arx1 [Perkinsus olseni]
MSDSEYEDEVTDLSNPDVTTKYITAAGITNKALELVCNAVKPGADVYELCRMGDDFVEEQTGKLYNKKVKGVVIPKGIAFPTCISVNEVAGHFSPLQGESVAIKEGDIVKVDLAVQIDGFITAAANTVVAGDAKVSGKAADVVMAAHTAAEAVLRKVKLGNTNTDITNLMQQVADEYGVEPIRGVLSHQLEKHNIEGENAIASKFTDDLKVPEFVFGLNEVYCLDILMSTGEGKARPSSEYRTTVYRRAPGRNYTLKLARGRQFLTEADRRFPSGAFSLADFKDITGARYGVQEALKHELLHEYPVLCEKPNEIVAQFKFTVLLLPGGTKKVAGLPFTSAGQFETDKTVKNEELKSLLAQSANPKKNKKKAKKNKEQESA